jgi:hypothetical protein
VDLPSARRPLRPGDALEDGRADPAAKTISSTLASHLLIISPQGICLGWAGCQVLA